MKRQKDDSGAQLDSGCPGGQGGAKRNDGGEVAVVHQVVFADENRLKTQFLGQDGLVDDILADLLPIARKGLDTIDEPEFH